MSGLDYKDAFIHNETEANRYSAKCLRILAFIVMLIWLLNTIGLFTVLQNIMTIAAVISLIFFLLPTFLCRICRKNTDKLKYYIMFCCVLGITCLGCALPKHTVLAWAAPIILSCHYYSRKLSWGTLAASIFCMILSLPLATYFGEWDPYFLRALPYEGERIITGEMLFLSLQFYIFPRCLTLVGMNAICSTLALRTRKLLEKQIRDSAAKQQIESELAVATHIQTSMLPAGFPEREEFELYASMTPAKEVGGDFYDFFMLDERHLAIVMADVSGKGVPAALFMVIGKTLIKDHTHGQKDLGEVFTEVNELLCESNSEGLFITAFEGVLDLVTGEFNFVNAGHEMPMIARAGEAFAPHKLRPGFVLAGMEGMRYKAGSMTLEPGDKIFQYTDGVTEATDSENQLYGMQRLTDALGLHMKKSPREIIVSVQEDIDKFVGDAPQFDDITMLCLEYKKRLILPDT